MTVSFKVNRQGHVFVFNIFDVLDLENVRIDTKIDFVSCLQPDGKAKIQGDIGWRNTLGIQGLNGCYFKWILKGYYF